MEATELHKHHTHQKQAHHRTEGQAPLRLRRMMASNSLNRVKVAEKRKLTCHQQKQHTEGDQALPCLKTKFIK